MNLSKITLVSLAILMYSFLTGCQTTREVLDLETSLKLNFNVSHQVNPDEDGRPSPLSISMVLLSDNKQFEQLDFIKLFQDSKTALAGELVSERTLPLMIPGETRQESLILSEQVRYVGFVAAYSKYNKAATKLIVPITRNAHNEYTISVNQLGISSY